MVTRHVQRPSWSSYALALGTVLAGLLLWQGLSSPRAAYAQIPDSGAQFNEMIREMRTSNEKLTEIAKLLRDIRDAQAEPKKDQDRKAPTTRP
jgi:hypothetical protein